MITQHNGGTQGPRGGSCPWKSICRKPVVGGVQSKDTCPSKALVTAITYFSDKGRNHGLFVSFAFNWLEVSEGVIIRRVWRDHPQREGGYVVDCARRPS